MKNRKLWIFFTLFVLFIPGVKSQDVVFDWAKPFRAILANSYLVVKSMKVDSSKNTYIVGKFKGTIDFDPGSATYALAASQDDIFVCKMDSSGNLLWATSTGSTGTDEARSMDIDTLGNIIVSGVFQNTVDFDPGSGTYNLTSAGMSDAYLWKLSSAGSLIWAKRIGGSQGESINTMDISKYGRIICSGTFDGTADFDPGAGVYNLSPAGNTDVFIGMYDLSGGFIWAKRIGTTSYEQVHSVGTDAYGNIALSGTFSGTCDFDPGTGVYNLTALNIAPDEFIIKLDSSGNFIWVKQLVGPAVKLIESLIYDRNGNILITGNFNDTMDFDPGSSIVNHISPILGSAFFIKLDVSGNYLWGGQIEGPRSLGASLDLDSSDNIYATGFFSGLCDFNFGVDTFFMNSTGVTGASELFILKLNPTGEFLWAKKFTSKRDAAGAVICLDKKGYVYEAGSFTDSVDVDPGRNTYKLGGISTIADGFLERLRPCFVSNINITVIACSNYKSPSQKYIWNLSGTYKDTLTNITGCDSIITVYLTIHRKTTSSISISACHHYLSPSNKYTWVSSGTYKDTITNAEGCDSLMTIQLAILNTAGSISKNTCNSFKSPSGKYIWTSSGTYLDTVPNAKGCDSIITVNLVIRNSTSNTLNITKCNTYKSPSGKHSWTTTGVYSDTLVNSKGCDSILIINLEIKKTTYDTLSPLVCGSYQSPSKKYIWTLSGIHYDTLSNIQGCDSILAIYLTVKPNYTRTIDTTYCNAFTWNTQVYTSSGTYTQVLTSSQGCDSTVILNLKINQSSSSSPSVTACRKITINGQTYTNSGVYIQNIVNAMGCDSVMTINLTVENIDNSITQTGNTLTSNESGALYQWLNCNNNKAPMIGHTAKSFTPTTTGSYAVQVRKNSCTDTSSCYTSFGVGITEPKSHSPFIIYPNPTRGEFNIESKSGSVIEISINDITGRTIGTVKLQPYEAKNHQTYLKPGVYFLSFEHETFTRLIVIH